MTIRYLLLVYLTILSVLTQNSLSINNNLIDSVSVDSLINSVKDLSGEQRVNVNGIDTIISKRQFNTTGNILAENYLFNKGIELGYRTSYQICSEICKNIIWETDGTLYPDSVVIIGAHFDSINPDDASGQTIYFSPGANDNASGCAAIIEIARLLKNYKPLYNMKFIFWDEEEIGSTGSYYYSDSAKKNGEKIKLYINLDMLGWDKNDDGYMYIKYVPAGQSLSFAENAVKICKVTGIELQPKTLTPKKFFIGFSGDADYFWQYGFNAIGLADLADDNSLYHTQGDRIKFFNEQFFLNNTKLALAIVINTAYEVETNVIDNIESVISFYPNPVYDYLIISGYDGKAEIINSLGIFLWKGFVKNGQRIDVSNLPVGIYFLKSGYRVVKFIKY